MITQIKEDYVGTWVVDTNTGEVISLVEDKKNKPKIAPFNKEIGVDVPHPPHCLTEKSLLSSLSVMDGYVKSKGCKPRVDSDFILTNLTEGHIIKTEAMLLLYIANNLSGWNYYITTISELTKCGVDKNNISRLFKSLAPNMLRIVHKDKPNRGCISIVLNPLIAWKGDYCYRDTAIKRWYLDREGVIGDKTFCKGDKKWNINSTKTQIPI